MSTYQGIRCRTCNQSTGCGGNHVIDSLLNLIQHAAILRDFAGQDIAVEPFQPDFHWMDENPVYFVIEHFGHDVCVYDEYGYDYNTGGQRIE